MKMQCRACMKSTRCTFFDMARPDAVGDKNLYDYFNECTQLHASPDDTFPKTLCKLCVEKLHEAYRFKKCAQVSHQRFKELLRKKSTQHSSTTLGSVFAATTTTTTSTDAMCSSKEGFYVLEEHIEQNTNDPLNMEFNEEVKALTEPELDFSSENVCVEEDYQIFGKDIKLEDIQSNKDDKCVTSLKNNDTSESVMASNFEKEEYESDNGAIDRGGYFCEVCNSLFVVKNELKKHIATEHKSSIICETCPKVFDMPIELNMHNKLVHETESPVQCDFCTENPSMARSELLKHFQKYHCSRFLKYFPPIRKRLSDELGGASRPFKCKYCIQKFTDAFDLADHIKKHAFKCPLCSKNFTKLGTYYSHAKRLHNCSAKNYLPTPLVIEDVESERDKAIECKPCKKRYRNLGSYNAHIRQKHAKKCISQETKQALESQAEYAEGEEDIQINKTKPVLESKAEYAEVEEDIEINETNHLEEILSQTSDNEIEMDNWMEEEKEKEVLTETKILEGSKSKIKMTYLCSLCPRILSSKPALEKHELTAHFKSKLDYSECPICAKRVRTDYLSKHLDFVHKAERNYPCDICGNTYKAKSRLLQHIKLHNKEQQLSCNLCDKTFVARNELNVHMRVHTGELPFACHICDRRFRIKVRLTYHLEQHNNVKHKCKECGKEYNNRTSLRVHSFEHTGIKPYKCPVCDYEVVKREVFTKHLLRKHDRTMTVDELHAMFKANTGRYPRVRLDEELEKLNETTQECLD